MRAGAVSTGGTSLDVAQNFNELLNGTRPTPATPTLEQRAATGSAALSLLERGGLVEDGATRTATQGQTEARTGKGRENRARGQSSDRGALARVKGPQPFLNRSNLLKLQDLLQRIQDVCDQCARVLNGFVETRLPGGGAAALDKPSTDAGQPLRRMFPSQYADGKSEPVSDRPNAREISNAVVASTGDAPNAAGASDLFWLWGQFLDHDIDLSHASGGSYDIAVPQGDAAFDPEGAGDATLPFHRSESTPNIFGAAQQVNAITALIDASNVYGSSIDETRALRSFEGGKLKLSDDGLLPKGERGFYVAGDERANENIGLTAMHTLFAREHNRLADAIAAENPGWNDEQIFQEARKWVTAELQAITFNEFLPILLGSEAIGDYRGPVQGLDAQIANSFSAAAYRFGHSMVSDDLTLIGNDGGRETIPLRDAFFRPDTFAEVGPDAIFRGLASNTAQAVDTEIVDSLRNFVMDGPTSVRLDLAALNIQRGRDHGLPTLNDARKALGMQPLRGFDDPALREGVGERLAQVYDSVDDIDLWVGLLAEAPQGDGLVGPTQGAILKDQFLRLRAGDPNWYENALSPDQVAAVNGMSLSQIIALNTDADGLQAQAMLAAPPSTPQTATA